MVSLDTMGVSARDSSTSRAASKNAFLETQRFEARVFLKMECKHLLLSFKRNGSSIPFLGAISFVRKHIF